jgi:hypothetical protein
MKNLLLILFILSVSSCGKKGVVMEPSSMGIVDSLTGKKDFDTTEIVNEQTCIDDILKSELSEKEYIKNVITDADINYCNGLRVRLKVFKMNAGKLRVYGFAESSSGKSSCLRDGSDFNKVIILGYEGTLHGDGIKISLGGHLYTAEKKLIKSGRRKTKYVDFDVASFKGEMGFYENNDLKCWAIH